MWDDEGTIFAQLRSLALEGLHANDVAVFRREFDLAPIEKSTDGWICLSRDGKVGFLDENGQFHADEQFVVSKTALLGSLAQRVPLASLYIPRPLRPRICPSCNGRGRIPGVPSELANTIRCQCGGLGWISDTSPFQVPVA